MVLINYVRIKSTNPVIIQDLSDNDNNGILQGNAKLVETKIIKIAGWFNDILTNKQITGILNGSITPQDIPGCCFYINPEKNIRYIKSNHEFDESEIVLDSKVIKMMNNIEFQRNRKNAIMKMTDEEIELEQKLFPNNDPNYISGTRPIEKEVKGAISRGNIWVLWLRSSEVKKKRIVEILKSIKWNKNKKIGIRQAQFILRT